MGERCVVIGNGCAFAECVKASRELGYSGEICVVSNNSRPPYNPMLIINYATGKIEHDALFPYGKGSEFYDRYDIVRFTDSPAISLDAENHIVKTADGLELSYSKCVIATGATPVLPAAFKNPGVPVYTLRTVEDGEKFKGLLESDKKRVLVAGASMVGVKVVEALVDTGFDVTLADQADFIFPQAACEKCAEIIQKIFEEKNVKLKFGRQSEINNGEFDHIVVCTGVKPNISFVDPAQVKTETGILVNSNMETSAKDLYAAGDAAQGFDIFGGRHILGLWSSARLQGRIAGQNIAGKRVNAAGAVQHNISRFFGNEFVSIGNIKNGDAFYEDIDTKNNRYLRLAFSGENLTGINILNISEISGILKYRMTKSLLTDKDFNESTSKSMAIHKLYEKYPGIEKAFVEYGKEVVK